MPDHEHHPDILTDEQAAAYLLLPSPNSMRTIRANYRIEPLDLPGERKWHRADLNYVIEQARAVNRQAAKRGRGKDTKLTLSGETA